ncbi:hypothetical protein [Gallaecimonas sp. GXIMD1310]|uniref:hypothetical protein n=1 Tax=Gallaecimonas sp. GXIMD1310 TaxID=3131926 RepID=UPI00324473B8
MTTSRWFYLFAGLDALFLAGRFAVGGVPLAALSVSAAVLAVLVLFRFGKVKTPLRVAVMAIAAGAQLAQLLIMVTGHNHDLRFQLADMVLIIAAIVLARKRLREPPVNAGGERQAG